MYVPVSAAIGSTLDIKLAKAKESIHGTNPKIPIPTPITIVEIIVPTTAYHRILIILPKKLPFDRLYPLSKMIGGNKNKKKKSLSNLNVCAPEIPNCRMMTPIIIPMTITTILSGKILILNSRKT